MSEHEPEAPYVYQPGPGLPGESTPDRIYGVAGVGLVAIIKGLTKRQAEAVCRALEDIGDDSQ